MTDILSDYFVVTHIDEERNVVFVAFEIYQANFIYKSGYGLPCSSHSVLL